MYKDIPSGHPGRPALLSAADGLSAKCLRTKPVNGGHDGPLHRELADDHRGIVRRAGVARCGSACDPSLCTVRTADRCGGGRVPERNPRQATARTPSASARFCHRYGLGTPARQAAHQILAEGTFRVISNRLRIELIRRHKPIVPLLGHLYSLRWSVALMAPHTLRLASAPGSIRSANGSAAG